MLHTLILCGGRGIRLFDSPSYIPKGMVKLGHKPILWHIMKRYSLYGYSNYTLALGLGGNLIRDYFLRYKTYTNDIQINLGVKDVVSLTHSQEENWNIILTDTGDKAASGARISRCLNYLPGDEFMVTYSDSVADIDIDKLIKFHRKSGKIATVTGVVPPYRALEFEVKNNLATNFYNIKTKKPGSAERYVNGGFMVFNKKIARYLSQFNECQLETDVFSALVADKQLAVYPHHGFWRWLDTDRDYLDLNALVEKNELYWLQNQK